MKNKKLRLSILKNKLVVVRLETAAPIPDWALSKQNSFLSITRTPDELSIVCHQSVVPKNAKAEKDWRALKVEGPLDFALTGILSSLLQPLAKAKISVFAISTYDTDYLLIKEKLLKQAIEVLSEGCVINK